MRPHARALCLSHFDSPWSVCPIASFCPAGASVPSLCPKGSYWEATGLPQDVPCPSGNYCASTGMASAGVACKVGGCILALLAVLIMSRAPPSATAQHQACHPQFCVPQAVIAQCMVCPAVSLAQEAAAARVPLAACSHKPTPAMVQIKIAILPGRLWAQ
jgi:hypothetical protein